MKILVWQWGRFGSGPRFALELGQALSGCCGSSTLLSLAEGAELMQSAVCRNVVDLPLRTYAGPAEFIWRSLSLHDLLRPLLERLKSDPPDAAIVPMMGYWDIFFMQALRRMGVPVVCVAHDVEVHPGDRFHLLVQLQRGMFRMSQGIITLTDFVARQLQSRIELSGKVHATIPHPAFVFSDLKLPPLHLPQARPDRPLRLLMAGRLKRYKGLELLAETVRLVRKNHALSVRIVGAPQNERDLEAFREFPSIEFDLGWKSDREFMAHLDWADACVLPYVEASQSGVAPMSFKRGRSVVATPVGGIPEQVCHDVTGLITEDVSATALAASIRRLAEDRDLVRRLGENARSHAETELSWKALAPRFAGVLEAAAHRRSRT